MVILTSVWSVNPLFRVGSQPQMTVAKTAKNVFIKRLPPDVGNLTTACLKLFHLGKIEKRTASYKSNLPYRSFALPHTGTTSTDVKFGTTLQDWKFCFHKGRGGFWLIISYGLKYPFWNSCIDDWSSFPNNVVEADNVSKFKKLLYKHLTAP